MTLINEKIDKTLTMLYSPEKTYTPNDVREEQEEENQKRWVPLFIPYAGRAADSQINYLRKAVPQDHLRVTCTRTN